MTQTQPKQIHINNRTTGLNN